ncbi:hypothetical protein G9A89_023616 [Geosiphon pyriformis]|nr:hypothetical protein G9A89_023616 [Geosiphon pyriformis]
MVISTEYKHFFATLVKTQSRDVRSVKTATSSRFHRLEILVAKILDAYKTGNMVRFQFLVDKWVDLDFDQTVIFKSSLGNGYDRVLVKQSLASFRKLYRSCKFLESKTFEDLRIQTAIEKCIEAFVDNKDQMIRNVLEKPFRKVMLDHLVDNGDLILEPDLVKSRVDLIMENWTRKRAVKLSMPSQWQEQFSPLNYVDNGAFSGVMEQIDFGEFLLMVKNLPDGKAAGLSSISNEMWKHCDESVLVLLLRLLNLCLVYKSVPDAWKEVWISMIPKPYEWDGVLTNTRPIALIETSRKILSKILSDRISRACIGSSIGDFDLVLAGLEIHLSAKKHCVESIYSCNVSYKKPKKLVVTGCIVNSLTGPLSLEDLGVIKENSVMF